MKEGDIILYFQKICILYNFYDKVTRANDVVAI